MVHAIACDAMKEIFGLYLTAETYLNPSRCTLCRKHAGYEGFVFFKSFFQLMLSEWLRSESLRIWRYLQKGFCLNGYVLVLQE